MGGLTDGGRRVFSERKNVNIGVMKMNASMRSDGLPAGGGGTGHRARCGGRNRRLRGFFDAMSPVAGTPCLPDVQTGLDAIRGPRGLARQAG